MFHVGDVIQKLRDAKGWTQEDLAVAAGVDKGTVVRAEAGRESRKLPLIARALGKDVGDLYNYLKGVTGPVTELQDPDDVAFIHHYIQMNTSQREMVRRMILAVPVLPPGRGADRREDTGDTGTTGPTQR